MTDVERNEKHLLGVLDDIIELMATQGQKVVCGRLQDIRKLIKSKQAEIERRRPVDNGGWIPVSELLPEDGSDILVYCDDGEESRIVDCNYDNGVWFDCVFNTIMIFKNITHWMPLPKPPKKDGGME